MIEWNPERLGIVPMHLRDGLTRYVEQGIRPGDGLLSILEDRPLSVIIGRSDDTVELALGDIYRFLYNYVPGSCHGTPERVAAWIERGGIQGR